MLTNASHLKGLAIQATDGEIGTVAQFYFDDETWAIRSLTVETGGWLGGRQVLISPISVVNTDWQAKRLDVALTKKQVENSPDIDTHRPVSRQHETEYFGYYGYPNYWGGPFLWGPAYYPTGLAIPTPASKKALADRIRRESKDSHLRSGQVVTGHRIRSGISAYAESKMIGRLGNRCLMWQATASASMPSVLYSSKTAATGVSSNIFSTG
jgi:hypothetical protein